MFPSQFLSIGMVLLVAMLLVVGLAAGNPGVVLVVVLFPVCVYLVCRPTMWLAALVAISWSRLTFPGAPVNMNLYHILSLVFVAFMVLYRMMHATWHRRSPMRKYVLAFALILIGIGAYRGFGLRALGSELWGGSPYAVLVIACLLLLSADVVTLTPRQWRNALLAMCLLTFLPAAAQMLYVFSGGAIFQQYMFIQPKGFIAGALAAVSDDQGIARFMTELGVSLLYIPLLLYARPFQGRQALVTVGGLIGSLLLAGLSGSRYSLITVSTYVFFWSLLGENRIRWGRAGFALFGAVLIVSLAAPLASHFPLPVQRSLSFIPWADVSQMALDDAKGTTIWRLDVWKRAVLEDVPRYWLVGRGFAFDPREYAGIVLHGLDLRDWAFVTASYHHGPLSLLINLGIGGLAAGLGFFVVTIREHLRMMRTGLGNEELSRIHRVVLAMFVNQTFLFMTLGGDVQNFFPVFLFQALVLEGVAKTADSLALGTPTPAPEARRPPSMSVASPRAAGASSLR